MKTKLISTKSYDYFKKKYTNIFVVLENLTNRFKRVSIVNSLRDEHRQDTFRDCFLPIEIFNETLQQVSRDEAYRKEGGRCFFHSFSEKYNVSVIPIYKVGNKDITGNKLGYLFVPKDMDLFWIYYCFQYSTYLFVNNALKLAKKLEDDTYQILTDKTRKEKTHEEVQILFNALSATNMPDYLTIIWFLDHYLSDKTVNATLNAGKMINLNQDLAEYINKCERKYNAKFVYEKKSVSESIPILINKIKVLFTRDNIQKQLDFLLDNLVLPGDLIRTYQENLEKIILDQDRKGNIFIKYPKKPMAVEDAEEIEELAEELEDVELLEEHFDEFIPTKEDLVFEPINSKEEIKEENQANQDEIVNEKEMNSFAEKMVEQYFPDLKIANQERKNSEGGVLSRLPEIINLVMSAPSERKKKEIDTFKNEFSSWVETVFNSNDQQKITEMINSVYTCFNKYHIYYNYTELNQLWQTQLQKVFYKLNYDLKIIIMQHRDNAYRYNFVKNHNDYIKAAKTAEQVNMETNHFIDYKG